MKRRNVIRKSSHTNKMAGDIPVATLNPSPDRMKIHQTPLAPKVITNCLPHVTSSKGIPEPWRLWHIACGAADGFWHYRTI